MRLHSFRLALLVLTTLLFLEGQAATLRLSGSNTVGADLGPALVQAWLKSEGYSGVEVDRKAEGTDIRAQGPDGTPMEVLIEARGSSTGFRDLRDAKADLAMSSRRIKDKEIAALADMGAMTALESEHIIALDGIAVIVHRENPISSLSKVKIRDIFLGKISDWQEIGGDPGAVALHARDSASGTFDVFRALLLGKGAKLPRRAVRFESNTELSDTVSKNRNAIGFVGLPYIRDAKALAISDGESSPISASEFTVATEDYAMSRRLYLYLPGVSENTLAREFANYAVSPAAQEVVDDHGFVSQKLFASAYRPHENYPAEVVDLTKGAKRLSLNIRFEADGVSLDNKAKRDLDRIQRMLDARNSLRKGLMLLGFTADDGAPKLMNLERSARVTRLASRYMTDKGVWVIKSRGYGATAAVASNETALGRQKNRRVEVWIRD